MTALTVEPRRVPRWSGHWLAGCEEFRVERAGRSLGFVEAVECTDSGEPAVLVVESAGGRLRVGVAEVAAVDPSRCLVVLEG